MFPMIRAEEVAQHLEIQKTLQNDISKKKREIDKLRTDMARKELELQQASANKVQVKLKYFYSIHFKHCIIFAVINRNLLYCVVWVNLLCGVGELTLCEINIGLRIY